LPSPAKVEAREYAARGGGPRAERRPLRDASGRSARARTSSSRAPLPGAV